MNEAPFLCVDPNSMFTRDPLPIFPQPPEGCIVEFPGWLGDGYCDWDSQGYNTAACNYDLGDCCKTSCVEATATGFVQFAECGTNTDFNLDVNDPFQGRDCVDPEYCGDQCDGRIPPECAAAFNDAGFFLEATSLGKWSSSFVTLHLSRIVVYA